MSGDGDGACGKGGGGGGYCGGSGGGENGGCGVEWVMVDEVFFVLW